MTVAELIKELEAPDPCVQVNLLLDGDLYGVSCVYNDGDVILIYADED